MTPGSTLQWRSALLEGFAVLVGILLAFSIDAWWDLRSQRLEGRSYLAAMRTELIANQSLVEEDLDSLRRWVDESRGFLETVVAPGAQPSYDEVSRMVWLTGPYRTHPLPRAALDDLISSGGFQSIENAELRRALASYQRALERDALEQEDVRDLFQQFVQLYHIEEGSFTEFPWEPYAEVPESAVTFRLPVEAFASNRVYANILIVRILDYSNLRESHREVLRQIDGSLQLMGSAA